jgi:tRNA A-37 threonylcarbamoyl transferase component Bud32
LQHGFGFAILGNQQRLAMHAEVGQHLRRVGLQVADGFDSGGIVHGDLTQK